MSKPLVILDRDGVINEDSDNYIKSPEEWIPIQGSIEAIAKLKKAGYLVAVATNQSGIARGYYNLDTLNAMHDKMAKLLQAYDVSVDYIAYCPHAPTDNCQCRKPQAGMLNEIIETLAADKNQTIMIGDKIADMQAAQNAGVDFALVKTGKGERTLASGELPDAVKVYKDLQTFVQAFIDQIS